MPAANPSSSVRVASTSRFERRRTNATPMAAIGPNSGPRTIAPMTRIEESTMMATPAIIVASTMNDR